MSDCSYTSSGLLAYVLGGHNRRSDCQTPESPLFPQSDHQLIRRWENAERPLAFIASPWELGPRQTKEDFAGWPRPSPGDLIFRPALPSLLRDTKFRSFFSDLGRPTLILMGAYLDEIILATAVDGFLAGHSIVIVGEATYMQSNPITMLSPLRDTALTLLSRFAKVVGRQEFLNECLNC